MTPAATESVPSAAKAKTQEDHRSGDPSLAFVRDDETLPPTFEDKHEERRFLKHRLALAYRIFAQFGFSEGVAGHITLRDPVDPTSFWVNPFGNAPSQSGKVGRAARADDIHPPPPLKAFTSPSLPSMILSASTMTARSSRAATTCASTTVRPRVERSWCAIFTDRSIASRLRHPRRDPQGSPRRPLRRSLPQRLWPRNVRHGKDARHADPGLLHILQ